MKRRNSVPIATVLIVAANLVAAFAVVVSPELISDLGFRANRPSILTAFSSLFLHANLLHLLGNMVFLAAVGAAVELATGSLRFVIVYLVGGLAGVLAHWIFKHAEIEPAPLIGASGAIAACVAYYNARYMSFRVAIAPKFSTSVLAVTGFWIALQIAGAFLQLGQPRAVSFYAHVGGLVAGGILALAFRTPDLGQLDLRHEVLNKMNERGPDAMIRAAREHLATHPGDITAWRHISEACRDLGERAEEIEALVKLVELSEAEAASSPIRRLIELNALDQIGTSKRNRFAEFFQSRDVAITRGLLEYNSKVAVGTQSYPDALLALAAFEREHEQARSQVLLNELYTAFPLHPATELARKRGWLG